MSYMTRARTVNLLYSTRDVFCRRINFYNSWECTCYSGFFGLCFFSVITDVLWLNFSRTDVLGAGANHNTFKYRQQALLSFQKKDCFLSPSWFLIRYQFLSLEWPLAVLQSSHSDLEYLFIIFYYLKEQL